MSDLEKFDYLIVGAGFYGVCLSLHLREKFPHARIGLIEKEKTLMQRASYTNQARVHNGYHYPRNFVTAYRSRINLPRFLKDFPFCVKTDFKKLYCIARINSKVNAVQFKRFSKEIGAKIETANQDQKNLFNPRLIEEVFEVEEYAFDTTKLAFWAAEQLTTHKIEILYQTDVLSVEKIKDGLVINSKLQTKVAFNATYSGLNTIKNDFKGTTSVLKHEITEMALIQPPKRLQDIGVTVMDGPFFSMMPFPAKGLHTLSHVRYTPHYNWVDHNHENPYKVLNDYAKNSRYDRMFRDVQRYMPAIEDAIYKESLFEVKTVLFKNESDDGRPILFESYENLPHFYSILGGKIDNIYDILDKVDQIIKDEIL